MAIVLCELARECSDNEQDSLFIYNKRQWRIMESLAPNANELISIITNFAKIRTKKLQFKILDSTVVLQQIAASTFHSANQHDLQLASELFPLIFINYAPTLEFQVMQEQHEQQRELKSYVTTQLYNALYCKHQESAANEEKEKPPTVSLPSCFKSQLRGYQQRTVSWMLSRECQPNVFPANFTICHANDGKHKVWKHNYCLQFYECDKEEELLPNVRLPPGGILADEMGLGKTVELLATLLLNPKQHVDNTYWNVSLEEAIDSVPLKRRCLAPKVHCICIEQSAAKLLVKCTLCQLWQHQQCIKDSHSDYVCPNCWTELMSMPQAQLVESRATIIVSPSEIKTQWHQEISKHVDGTLKVLLYPGLHAGVWYSPLELAQYDIVLTDYRILGHEIHHTPRNSSDREMRYEQRYMRPSSPLLMVNWWRVCLDEAQMVESSTSQAAEMVSQLPAVNRWAVTGTPIQKTIDDLAPLLKFVGFHEACEPQDAWHTVANSFLLKHKAEPLLELLQHCMWRTCKSKVEHELGIPPQTELVHRLALSNVESLYYREEHFKCTELFLEAVAKHTKYNPNTSSSRLASISPQLLSSMLQPFLRIRKTCSVPVVINKNVATTNYLNPQDLLVHLKTNNEMQCKRELRTWASSYNGLTAIHFILKQHKEAMHNYKQVLQLAKDYNYDNITVDSLLQIHALHNLLSASEFAADDDKLSEEELAAYRLKLNSLERKFLEEKIVVLLAAETAYEAKLEELDKLQQQFSSSIVQLFATVVNTSDNWHTAVWHKIGEEFFRQNISSEKLQDVNSVTGLIYILHNWHDRLEKQHKQLRKDFKFLKRILLQACGAVREGVALSADANQFIKVVSDCHLADIMEDKPAGEKRQDPRKKRHCSLCKIHETVNKFECLLFDKELGKEGTITDGSENSSMEIMLIRVVFGYLRGRHEFAEWKTECKNKLEQLDCMQSLEKLQIKYWIEAEYVIKAFDELDMCKMRILLTENPEEQSNFRILPYQLEEQTEFNMANIEEAQLNFVRLSGRLKYLKHLKDDAGDKPCPICQTLDDDRYVMLSCGHYLCQECLDTMRSKFGRKTKCPICRQDSPQLYYSVRKGVNRTKINGDFSTKIVHIVEQVQKIQAEDSEQKILIFSQWATILNHIASALQMNGIKYRNKFTNRDIDEFKQPELKITCMLMPLSRGSKGLNLIEATHVFLVEPILTPGEELQAIGRVHRFGQTKPTTVHRFIVNGTIEENIMTLIKSADDRSTLSTHWDLDNMTLDSLKDLFTLKQTD
ncbi:E3 ubiquitin-protein ligase SHPRH [Drosophila albomicans]|uniref:E3 ubiquitin-protein ligase SHPRH n=1 Tax=Drosophila albomicans TaxID=7291 RepID=A0A6P8XK32_DROAB|nr:E3 ubiquitin-protein ligase SHPRH [Drosophila albomicans]